MRFGVGPHKWGMPPRSISPGWPLWCISKKKKKNQCQYFTVLVSCGIICIGLEYSYLFSQLTYYTYLFFLWTFIQGYFKSIHLKKHALTMKHRLPITQSDKAQLLLQTLCFALQPQDIMVPHWIREIIDSLLRKPLFNIAWESFAQIVDSSCWQVFLTAKMAGL